MMHALIIAAPLAGLILMDTIAFRSCAGTAQRYGQLWLQTLLASLSTLVAGIGAVAALPLQSFCNAVPCLIAISTLIVSVIAISHLPLANARNVASGVAGTATITVISWWILILHGSWQFALASLCLFATSLPILAALLIAIGKDLDQRQPAGSWTGGKRTAALAAILWLWLFHLTRALA